MLAAASLLAAGTVQAEPATLECKLDEAIYYVRIGEPSFLNRFRRSDPSAVSVELRYYLDAEFSATSVNNSDENGIAATMDPAPRGAPDETTFTRLWLSRTGTGTMLMTHYKAVPIESSGIGKHRHTTYDNQQLGPKQVFMCSKHQPPF